MLTIESQLKPTPLKRVIYLIATAVLGIEINYLILAAIQFFIMRWLLNSEANIIHYSGYPPHLIFLIGFLVLGAVWGFLVGRHWWQIVYIEKRFSKDRTS